MEKGNLEWEVIHRCEAERLDKWGNPHDCDEPAAYYVWWDAYEDGEYRCEKHLNFLYAKDSK